MNEADYKRSAKRALHRLLTGLDIIHSVVDTLRLADGTLFPIPIALDLSQEDVDAKSIAPGKRIALRDPRDDEALAVLSNARNQPPESDLVQIEFL